MATEARKRSGKCLSAILRWIACIRLAGRPPSFRYRARIGSPDAMAEPARRRSSSERHRASQFIKPFGRRLDVGALQPEIAQQPVPLPIEAAHRTGAKPRARRAIRRSSLAACSPSRLLQSPSSEGPVANLPVSRRKESTFPLSCFVRNGKSGAVLEHCLPAALSGWATRGYHASVSSLDFSERTLLRPRPRPFARAARRSE